MLFDFCWFSRFFFEVWFELHLWWGGVLILRYLDIDITAYSSVMFIIISERNVVPLVICYVFFYSEFVDQVSHDYLQHYSGILCYSSSKPAIAQIAPEVLLILSWSLVAPARSFLFSLLLRLPCKAKSATSQISLKHKSRRVQHSIRIPIPQVMSLQSRGVACLVWVGAVAWPIS